MLQTLTTHNDDSPQTASRIQIQRSSSSSSSSENSKNSRRKRSRQRRKKASVSNERSTILKQIKRKTKEKKSSKSPTNSDNSSDNPSKTKKSKFTNDDDDDDDDDDDKTTTDDDDETSPSKGKNGRKNIRKILDDKELDIQTKDAIEAERERRKRIAEKQKIYNDSLLEQSTYMTNDTTDEQSTNSNTRLILELDKITNEPLIEVSSKLVEQLKPHQCDGIRFLWNNVFESIDAIQNKKRQGNGCILAHCMGLGKTLQVISFIHTIFNYKEITNFKTCLVLCPINAGKKTKTICFYFLMNFCLS
jgi:transcriptional regulator ATRX